MEYVLYLLNIFSTIDAKGQAVKNGISFNIKV